jgi:hypothetical protein
MTCSALPCTLQAEVNYIEAEAAVAALKRRGADVVPASREVRHTSL